MTLHIMGLALLRLVAYPGLMHGVCKRLPGERLHECRLLRSLLRSIKMVSETEHISTGMEFILPRLLHSIRMVFKTQHISKPMEFITRCLRNPMSRQKMTDLFFHKPHTLHLQFPRGVALRRASTRTVSIMPQKSLPTTLSKAPTIPLQPQQTPHSISTCFSCRW